MKFDFKAVAGAICIAALSATGAQALTTIATGIAGGASVPLTSTVGDTTTVSFAWSSAPASGFLHFSTTNDFSLSFAAYSSVNPAHQMGLTLVDASTNTALLTDSTACAAAPLAQISEECALVGNNAISFKVGDTLLASVAAGTYYIGYYESASPANGSAAFTITEVASSTSEVPLPAGGLLLVGALGGLAALRRRKKA